MKIKLSIADTYLKVKDRHFGFSMEEQLKNLLNRDKIKSELNLLLLWKKSQEKVYCISANVFDTISLTTLEPFELRANMRNLSIYILSLKIASATLAERRLPQYSHLLTALTQHDFEKAKSFDSNDTKLDHFFFNESSFKMPTVLQSVMKLILSNKQGSVERGLNVNKTLLNVSKNE